MQERCPVCDLKFAREAGYFIGAMYISYGIALLTITLIAALLWAVTGWWITKDVIWAVILFLPFPLSHFSPVFCGSIWIRRLIRRHDDFTSWVLRRWSLAFMVKGYVAAHVVRVWPTTKDERPTTQSQSRAALRIPISSYLCAKVP